MDNEAREFLYEQLKALAEDSDNKKENAQPLINRQKFFELSDVQKLSYIFWYRDTQTSFENSEGQKENIYIMLPNMDLEGQDLSKTVLPPEITGLNEDVVGIRLRIFCIATKDDNNNFVLSKINLKNTNIEINLSDILHTKIESKDEKTLTRIIDFSEVDFTGCNLFGILKDEYRDEENKLEKYFIRYEIKGKENLDAKYLERRKKYHLTPEQKNIADRAYEKLLNAEFNGENIDDPFYNMRGRYDPIILTDYDLTEISPFLLATAFSKDRTQLQINFTGLRGTTLGKEILQKNIFQFISSEEKYNILLNELNNDNIEFLKENIERDFFFIHSLVGEIYSKAIEKDISDDKRKELFEIISNNFSFISAGVQYKILSNELNKDNIDFIKDNIAKGGTSHQIDKLIEEIYSKASEKDISDDRKEELFEIINRSFKRLNNDVKYKILSNELNKNNINMAFIKKNINSIDDDDYMVDTNGKKTYYIDKLVEEIYSKASEKDINDNRKEELFEIVNTVFKSTGSERIKYLILSNELNKDNIDFIKDNIISINADDYMVDTNGNKVYYIDKLIEEIYSKANEKDISDGQKEELFEIVNTVFKNTYSSHVRYKILSSELNKDNVAFLKKNMFFISDGYYIRSEGREEIYYYVDKLIEEIYSKANEKDISDDMQKELFEIVNAVFKNIDNDHTKYIILLSELNKDNVAFLKKNIDFVTTSYSDTYYYDRLVEEIYLKASEKDINDDIRKELFEMVSWRFLYIDWPGQYRILSNELNKKNINIALIKKWINPIDDDNYINMINKQEYFLDDFIEKIYSKASEKDINNDMRKELFEIISDKFKRLNKNVKYKILSNELNKNNINMAFIKKNINSIDDDDYMVDTNGKKTYYIDKLVEEIYSKASEKDINDDRKEELFEIVSENFKRLNKDVKYKILSNELNKDNIDFIKDNIAKGKKSIDKLIEEIYSKANEKDISNDRKEELFKIISISFNCLHTNVQYKILSNELNKNNIAFLKKKIGSIDTDDYMEDADGKKIYYINKLIKEIYSKASEKDISNDRKEELFEIISNNFSHIDPSIQYKILSNELNKNNIEFTKKNINSKFANYDYIDKLVEGIYSKASEKDISNDRKEELFEIISNNFDHIDPSIQYKILSNELNKDNMAFLKENISSMGTDDYMKDADGKETYYIDKLIEGIYSKASEKDISNDRKEELFKIISENFKRLHKNAKYKILSNALNKDNIAFLKENISSMGTDDYIEEADGKKTYYIDKLVDEIYSKANEKDISDDRRKELFEIVDKCAEMPNLPLFLRKQLEHSQFFYSIGLSPNQQVALNQEVPSLKDKAIKGDLELKKIIFDKFGCTKDIFDLSDDNYNFLKYLLLVMSPETIYQRLKFFEEYGNNPKINVKVSDENFILKIGIANRAFLRKFANKIITQDPKETSFNEYAKRVKKFLDEKYPLPKDKEAFEKAISEIKVHFNEMSI